MEATSSNLAITASATEYCFAKALATTWRFQLVKRWALRQALDEMRKPNRQIQLCNAVKPSNGCLGYQYSLADWIEAILDILEFLPGFGFVFAVIKVVFDYLLNRPLTQEQKT